MPGFLHGYYLMKWGAGRWTSVAFFGPDKKAEAEKELKRVLAAGYWTGRPPYIEEAEAHPSWKDN